MPCNCDYMDPNNLEKSISQVACLLDELDGKKINKDHWSGYHPLVYGKWSKKLGDDLTSTLCEKLSNTDVTKYSLRLQLWWEEHQEADIQRKKEELKKEKLKKKKSESLSIAKRAFQELSEEEQKAIKENIHKL